MKQHKNLKSEMNKNHIRHIRAQKKKLNDLNVLMV